jgi:hypothetical protein
MRSTRGGLQSKEVQGQRLNLVLALFLDPPCETPKKRVPYSNPLLEGNTEMPATSGE